MYADKIIDHVTNDNARNDTPMQQILVLQMASGVKNGDVKNTVLGKYTDILNHRT